MYMYVVKYCTCTCTCTCTCGVHVCVSVHCSHDEQDIELHVCTVVNTLLHCLHKTKLSAWQPQHDNYSMIATIIIIIMTNLNILCHHACGYYVLYKHITVAKISVHMYVHVHVMLLLNTLQQ